MRDSLARTLSAPPRLLPALVRGAVTAPLKRLPPHEDASLPGTRLVLPAARIDPERLASYARICGFPRDGAVPLPYPHVLGFPLALRIMTEHHFPLPVLGLVHTWIEVSGRRALTAGDRPALTVYAERLAPHRRGTEVIMVTEARIGDEPVWTSRGAYLARHGTHTPHSFYGAHASHPSHGAVPADDAPDAPDAAALLAATARWRLPARLGRRYGAVSGDRNPIHLHPLAAKPFGYPRAVAHGMWTFARCVAEAETGRGTPPATHARAEFRAPVPLPGTVTYVSRSSPSGVAFELRDGAGARVHVTGRLSSASARRP
ncbi:MaoC family dehydratase [Streptomyces sp. NPDC127033]|uniref:MaoC family dehydratase n=1 Tax=Streptomyces sp. NPDC127033 TaxID=3347110 RepID=UPI003647C2DF